MNERLREALAELEQAIISMDAAESELRQLDTPSAHMALYRKIDMAKKAAAQLKHSMVLSGNLYAGTRRLLGVHAESITDAMEESIYGAMIAIDALAAYTQNYVYKWRNPHAEINLPTLAGLNLTSIISRMIH